MSLFLWRWRQARAPCKTMSKWIFGILRPWTWVWNLAMSLQHSPTASSKTTRVSHCLRRELLRLAAWGAQKSSSNCSACRREHTAPIHPSSMTNTRSIMGILSWVEEVSWSRLWERSVYITWSQASTKMKELSSGPFLATLTSVLSRMDPKWNP